MISEKQRELIEHAVAWRHPRNPLYRNHFAASVGSPEEDWWKQLANAGLAAEGHVIPPIRFFYVTARGLDALGAPPTKACELAMRRRRVQKLKSEGLSRAVIAERLGITQRQVRTAEKD